METITNAATSAKNAVFGEPSNTDKAKNAADDVGKKGESAVKEAQSSAESAANDAHNGAESAIDTGKKQADKAYDAVADAVSK